MSLESIKEMRKNLSENSVSILLESKNIFIRVLPFSKLIESRDRLDIYTGEETIPFEKRDPLYKSILRKEFSNAIKEFSKTINNLM